MITLEQALEQAFSLVSPSAQSRWIWRTPTGGFWRLTRWRGAINRPSPPRLWTGMPCVGRRIRIKSSANRRRVRVCGAVSTGEAVRIFTGAPVPNGATRVIPQEMCERVGDSEGDNITVENTGSNNPEQAPDYIRPQGADFAQGFVLSAPVRLDSPQIALLAAMNCARVSVRRKPVIALVSMGMSWSHSASPPTQIK